MPNVVVIAGPNGAGKSTLAPVLLRDRLGIAEFVNADTIASGLSAFSPESVAIESGRIMLRRIEELTKQHVDFSFEATLAGRHYAKLLKELMIAEYCVHIVFLWLDSPELAIKRVASRVADGGHDIPVEIIRRRYKRSIDNFVRIYLPIADSWQLLNVSNEDPVEVAFGARMNGVSVVDEAIWTRLKS